MSGNHDYQVGQAIGRYQIVQLLGKGGMATVYKALDTRLERYVAIKMLHAIEEDETFLIRFEREAKALAHLSHPHIVKVLDYGDENGSPYLIMEYIGGGTLKDRMGQPIPWQQASQILLPITQALDYAHNQNIIHRDVKPANILITEYDQPMLSDFGIAKTIGQQTHTDLTGTGFGIGTPHYMAPEQGFGKKLDGRADIYSLGVVMYEMITGRLPFDADTPMAVVLMHATETPPLPHEVFPGIPEPVENVILRAMAKIPEDRFPSMATMGAALENLSRGVMPVVSIAPPVKVSQQVLPATQVVMPEKSIEKAKKPTRSRSVGRWLLTFFGILIAALVTATLIISLAGAAIASRLIQTAFSNIGYTFTDTDIERTEFLTEYEATQALNNSLDMFSGDWINSLDVNFQSPDRAFITADTSYGQATIEIKIT
jgi:serine/threonine protein kinase